MTQHFIHYIPRRIITRYPSNPDSPWFAEVQSLGEGFKRPQFHIAHSGNNVVTAVKKGDIIWLVGQVFSPWGNLPPSLDGRIDVGEIKNLTNQKRKFIAKKSSIWFPLTDATKLLKSLKTVNSKNLIQPLWSDPKKPIGFYLQSLRRLESGDGLELWEQELKNKEFQFLSYRICDGTCQAFKKVSSLINGGGIIFWDRWSLPRRLAERRELVSDKSLDIYIMNKLDESNIVWGIESNKYSVKGSYSAKEKLRAESLKKYRAVSVN